MDVVPTLFGRDPNSSAKTLFMGLSYLFLSWSNREPVKQFFELHGSLSLYERGKEQRENQLLWIEFE